MLHCESIREGRNGVEVGKIERLERGRTLGLLDEDPLKRVNTRR